MAKKHGAWNTSRLKVALANRYKGEAWAFFTEVRDSTGSGVARTADALAMGLWPSRGIELHGFEIKVARSDVLKELADPSKAEAIQRFCDRWWLVLSSATLITDSELPKNWGLLVPSGRGLRVKKDAPELFPEPVDRRFLASICRQVHRTPGDVAEKARTAGFEAGHKSASAMRKSEIEGLRQVIKKFEEGSGVSLKQAWQAGSIGEAVRTVLEGRHLSIETTLRGLKSRAARIVELLDDL